MRRDNTAPAQISGAISLNELLEETRIVFRVFDSCSFRAYDPASGFSATGFDENTSVNRAELLNAHLDPTNRTIVAPWISTTRRWLWALWEMNRRYESRSTGIITERHSPKVQVAVIDLAACQLEGTEPSRTSTFDRSLILRPNGKKKKADTSDEILIYGKIPAAAIVSVWTIKKFFGILELPRLFSFQIPLHPDRASFRQVQEQLIALVSSPSQRKVRKASEEGERCASTAKVFMQDGYNRLEQQIDIMIKPIRKIRSHAGRRASRPGMDEHLNNLARGMETLSAGEGSLAGSQNSNSTTGDNRAGLPHTPVSAGASAAPHDEIDAAQAQSVAVQRKQDEAYKILPGDVIGYSDPLVFGAYMSLMAHHRLITHQISALTSGPTDANQVPTFLTRELSHFNQQRSYYEPVIVRIARQKIERLRGLALEFTRNVPTGVLDQLNIDQHDSETM
ncbi:unnamed protein product [Rhizoctonia solani]|uniref:DUF7587 domain-containing protein n=1 Tax=Rhizoctonia solani TaxID=456999 RepID=A0A8H3CQK7_9AGAM|nr:unnamed protein product [Rhizoctonia solani]